MCVQVCVCATYVCVNSVGVSLQVCLRVSHTHVYVVVGVASEEGPALQDCRCACVCSCVRVSDIRVCFSGCGARRRTGTARRWRRP